ncbi:hypothetical protein P4B35_05270 [Pontiellaceae bacterium B12227]|nr:hypothetical protein [Pontiellaceae bacterium B12227]
MNAPEWNKQDKAGSLQKWIKELNAEARYQFLEAGTHLEIFFVFNDEGLMEVVPIVGMEKDEIISELRKMLSGRNGYAFIHIAEVTARHMDSNAEADSLMVHAESREGLTEAWFSTVTTQGDEKLLLDAVKVEGASLDGRFCGIFRDLES